MRIPTDDLTSVRAPSEALARWALETPIAAQEATWSALSFLAVFEHASVTLLPAPALLQTGEAIQDPDGFLRVRRGALDHFRQRSARAVAWMEQVGFFRERFPEAARREPPQAVMALAQTFSSQGTPRDRAIDVLVRESVMPEIEDLFLRTLTYPPMKLLLRRMRESEPQMSADAKRLAAGVVGELGTGSVWAVRKRLVATATRAILGARPLLDELARGGAAVDRSHAAKGFARRLEAAVAELSGTPVVPAAIIERLAGEVASDNPEQPVDPEEKQS
ncbi:MAG: hypothetical protein ACJ79W_08265 [Myxococcales bacterium]